MDILRERVMGVDGKVESSGTVPGMFLALNSGVNGNHLKQMTEVPVDRGGNKYLLADVSCTILGSQASGSPPLFSIPGG